MILYNTGLIRKVKEGLGLFSRDVKKMTHRYDKRVRSLLYLSSMSNFGLEDKIGN